MYVQYSLVPYAEMHLKDVDYACKDPDFNRTKVLQHFNKFSSIPCTLFLTFQLWDDCLDRAKKKKIQPHFFH